MKHPHSLSSAAWATAYLATIALLVSCAKTETPPLPETAAEAFYRALGDSKISGLPTGQAWAALQPLCTLELIAAVETARAEQAKSVKRYPDGKPPSIEDGPFRSRFEDSWEFTVGEAQVENGAARVPIHFTVADHGETIRWTDTLLLRGTGKKWLVSDVVYGGSGDFANHGTLVDALAPPPDPLSPDGRFEFVTYSPDEVEAGKPPFGIIEKPAGRLIWSAPEDLGDPTRPEETILWSRDSSRFALTSRIGTRHVGCFFFRWEENSFVSMPWTGSAHLEELADQQVQAAARSEGFTDAAAFGMTLTDDTVPIRWVDPDTIILRRTLERTISEGDDEAVVTGTVRALFRWDTESAAFTLDRDPRMPPP